MSARVKGVRVASAPPWPQEIPRLGLSENQESGMSGQGLGAGCWVPDLGVRAEACGEYIAKS